MKSLFKKFKNKLDAKGSFLKAVSVLAGGTAFAQVIGVLFLPVLTRLYTPEDFSLYATYVAIVSIAIVCSTLRYELGIPLPEKKKDAISLLKIALSSNIAFFIVTSLLVFTLYSIKLENSYIKNSLDFLWLIPLSVFLSSCYNIFQYWATREKSFNIIAKSRVSQSLLGVGAQLALSTIGFMGLIIGQLINFSAGLVLLTRFYFSSTKGIKRPDFNQLRETAIEYKSFPKYSVVDALSNTAGSQLPVIIIGIYLIGPEAGYLLIASKVMMMPLGLLGSSIAQVYYSHSATSDEDSIKVLTKSTVEKLYIYGIGIIVLFGFIAPELFSFIFGKDWLRAGELVSWMTPWFVMQFLSSPISMIMHVKGKQKKLMLLTSFGFLLRVISLIVGITFFTENALEIYSLSGGVYYGLCYYIFTRTAGLKLKDDLYFLKKSIGIIFICITVGILFKYLGGIYL